MKVTNRLRSISTSMKVRKFFVSRIDIIGLDDPAFRTVLKDVFVRPGEVYDRRLVDLFAQKHASLLPSNASPDSAIDLRRDERAGTVPITYDFRRCGVPFPQLLHQGTNLIIIRESHGETRAAGFTSLRGAL